MGGRRLRYVIDQRATRSFYFSSAELFCRETEGKSVMMKRAMCAAIALCVASGANAATLRLKNYLAPEDEK